MEGGPYLRYIYLHDKPIRISQIWLNPMGLVDQLVVQDFVTQMYEGIFLETGRTSLWAFAVRKNRVSKKNHVFKPEFYYLLHL